MRVLAILLLMLGLASSTGLSPYLEQAYAAQGSATPDPSSGRVYLHAIRGGRDVYFSGPEHWAVFGSFAGGILLAICGGALFARQIQRNASAA